MNFMKAAIRRSIFIIHFIVLITLTTSQSIVADECAQQPVRTADDAIALLNDLRSNGCVGGENCTTELCEEIGLFEKGEMRREKFQKAGDLYNALRRRAENIPQASLGRSKLMGMFDQWNMALSGIEKIKDLNTITNTYTIEWKPDITTLFPRTRYELKLDEVFTEKCTDPQNCQKTFDEVLALYAYSVKVHRILKKLISSDSDQFGKYMQTLDNRWHAYHNDTRAIFPQEQWLNGLFYKPRKKGFGEPPNSQLLFLHPSVGLAYQDADNDDELQSVIAIDLLGFYHWTWGGESNAKIAKPYGLAISTMWNGDEWSYGPTVHLPKNYSIGAMVDNDGDWSLLFSVDLGNYLMDKKKAAEELRKQVVTQD